MIKLIHLLMLLHFVLGFVELLDGGDTVPGHIISTTIGVKTASYGLLEQPTAGVLQEEKREAPKGGKAEAASLVGAALQVALPLGDGEDRACGVDGPRPEADQQLVHQPEETVLEAVGGHAVRHDGRIPSAERRRSLHIRPSMCAFVVPER